MPPLLYVVGLLLIFYVLLVVEFLLPTGGLLGLGAGVAALTAIIVAFTHSSTAGLSVIVVVVGSTPVVLLFMIRLWPHTPIGRRMLNRRPGELAPDQRGMMPDGTPVGDLVGRIGTAQTDMLPSGMVMIDGQKLHAVSMGMPIDAGTTVIVTKTVGRKIQVRAARDEDLNAGKEPPESASGSETPLQSFDLESLE